MKKSIFILAVFFGITIFSSFKGENFKTIITYNNISNDEYCDGWADGYCEGWKDVKGSFAICPITPICPIPEIGKDGYKGGYNRGFKAGFRAASK